MFQIDLSSREPGVHRITRTVAADAVQEEAGKPERGTDRRSDADEDKEEDANPITEEVDFGPVHVDAVLDYQPDRALVTFQARAPATLTCDRTLRRYEEPLEGQYAVLFAAPGRNAPEESDEHDELRELTPGARYLDLTDAVRDTLLLAVPQRRVAPGAEEEELDTVFGAPDRDEGDPVDPRFEKLRELRANGGAASDGDSRNT